MARYRLWTLNRITSWEGKQPDRVRADGRITYGHDLRPLRRAIRGGLLARLGLAPTHDVVLGDRSTFSAPSGGDMPDERTRPGALMHEGGLATGPHGSLVETHHLDEYFVPIIVKCIGDPNTFPVADDHDARARFAALLAAHPQHYQDRGSAEADWMSYWTHGRGPWSEVRMRSRTGVGYYQMLQESQARTDERALLVGYSQGGLVARFLAWLDEHVARRGLVHGVITVQAPNFGSPLATAKNAARIVEHFGRAAAAIPGLVGDRRSSDPFDWFGAALRALPRGPAPLPPSVGTDTRGPVDLALLRSSFEWLIVEMQAKPALRADHPDIAAMASSARKWLSGLSGDPQFAFWGLDPEHNDVPGTMLHALASTPLRDARHAAVVGANNALDDMVATAIRGALFSRTTWWSRAADATIGWLLAALAVRLARTPLGDAAQQYKVGLEERDAVDDADVLRRTGAIADRKRLEYECALRNDSPAQKFRNVRRADGLAFDTRAHDFVIPAASQVLEGDGAAFLGTWVNQDAGHLSGATLADGGPTNLRLTREILRELCS